LIIAIDQVLVLTADAVAKVEVRMRLNAEDARRRRKQSAMQRGCQQGVTTLHLLKNCALNI
jgi:hypothetical protein